MSYIKYICLTVAILLQNLLGASNTVVAAEDPESQKQAREFIASLFSEISIGQYMSAKTLKASLSPDEIRYYFEYDSFSWRIVESKLSRTDDLNGVKFKGEIITHMLAYRRSSDILYETGIRMGPRNDRCWEDWKTMQERVNLKWSITNTEGKWKIFPVIHPDWAFNGYDLPIGNRVPTSDEILRVSKFKKCQ